MEMFHLPQAPTSEDNSTLVVVTTDCFGSVMVGWVFDEGGIFISGSSPLHHQKVELSCWPENHVKQLLHYLDHPVLSDET